MSTSSWIPAVSRAVLRGLCLVAGAVALGGPAGAVTAPPSPAASAAAARSAQHKTTPFHSQRVTTKAKEYFAGAWGVDKLKVRYTSSGNLIRFSYRVSDAERAKPLAAKEATPYLVGLRSNAVLRVPQMDKVGTLRQTAPPQAGQEYWMVFSNKGNLVRPGDRVTVVIGPFHADGLLVE